MSREQHWTDTAPSPVFQTVIPAYGSAANINTILRNALGALAHIGVPRYLIGKLAYEVRNAPDYETAIARIERWFRV